MRDEATTWNRKNEPVREITIKIKGKRNILSRLSQMSKSAAWEEKIPVIEKWLDIICRGFIGLSVVYFIAVLIWS